MTSLYSHESTTNLGIMTGTITIEGTTPDGTPIKAVVHKFISDDPEAIQLVEVWDALIRDRHSLMARDPKTTRLRIDVPIFAAEGDDVLIHVELGDKEEQP